MELNFTDTKDIRTDAEKALNLLSNIYSDTMLAGERDVMALTPAMYDILKDAEKSTGLYKMGREVKVRFDPEQGNVTYHESFIVPTSEFAAMWNERLSKAKARERENITGISVLSIDIETYSGADLKSSGVYRYVEDRDFDILLFGYSINGGASDTIDLACGEKLPASILGALTDAKVTKTAFNAAFERTCLSKYLGIYLDPAEWECTMVKCSMLGLPMSLKAVGEVLRLDEKKMEEGKDLIRYFTLPAKPTKANGGRTRNLPGHDPFKWEVFKRYNRRDVEVECEIRRLTASFRMPVRERELYALDQRINDRGVMLDMTLVANAVRMNDAYVAALSDEAAALTGLSNPNSVAQLKTWLSEQTGVEVKSLNKKVMPDIARGAGSGDVKRLLEIRAEMGKTSVAKYRAMTDAVCADGRVRGLLQFYGSRTGRWAGRLVQVQNLPQNHIDSLGLARRIVKDGDMDELLMVYGTVPDILSQLIRTAFVAKEGCTFIVSDFSAIEARVIAWLAGEKWRLEVFRTHGKIYEASASMMYHVPVDAITKTDPRRQKGKIAELALGYQGGVGAMKTMGGERMGLSEDEMSGIVEKWREQNPAIVGLWSTVEAAARRAIGGRDAVIEKGVRFSYDTVMEAMTIALPSGRKLYYLNARVAEGHFGRRAVIYEGQNQTTKKWEDIEVYGGKLVENIVQAIARDCLATTMLRLEKLGYPIVFHVHDEIIAEVPDDGTKTLDEVKAVFRKPIAWAEGLPLKGDGYVTKYYLKD